MSNIKSLHSCFVSKNNVSLDPKVGRLAIIFQDAKNGN
jgi:hypothetical protein